MIKAVGNGYPFARDKRERDREEEVLEMLIATTRHAPNFRQQRQGMKEGSNRRNQKQHIQTIRCVILSLVKCIKRIKRKDMCHSFSVNLILWRKVPEVLVSMHVGKNYMYRVWGLLMHVQHNQD